MECLERRVQGNVRGRPRGLRQIDRRRRQQTGGAVLQLDNAGWHGPENLVVPEGIRLVFQPSHSPELQPAEHLWAFVDEPLANTYFETIENLDKVVGERCVALMEQQNMISASTLFHWWPRQCVMK